MTEITPLPGINRHAEGKLEPNKVIIKYLGELLELANNGEIQSMAFAAIHNDGATTLCDSFETYKDQQLLIGALEELKIKWLSSDMRSTMDKHGII